MIVVKPAHTSTTASPSTPAPAATSGQLPFTGVSLVGAAVLGLGLTGFGLMLRRRGRHDES